MGDFITKNLYDKSYFEGDGSNYVGGYKDEPLFLQLAHYIKEKTYPIKGKILEIGCAKGYLVKNLRELGLDAYGCDISEYAVNESPIKEFLKVGSLINLPYKGNEFEWVYSFDTLEHLHEDEVEPAIKELLRVGEKHFHSITTPEYTVGEDKTHFCMKPISWWKEKFPIYPNIVIKHAGQN